MPFAAEEIHQELVETRDELAQLLEEKSKMAETLNKLQMMSKSQTVRLTVSLQRAQCPRHLSTERAGGRVGVRNDLPTAQPF